MGNNFEMVAKTMHGFEDLLAGELGKLGAGNVEKGIRSVRFTGDTGFMYKANLNLRSALKIVKPIGKFRVRDERDLYNKIFHMDWKPYLDPEKSFAIQSVLKSAQFSHSLYVSQKVKDAIVDKFRNTHGKRPSVDTKNPDLRIHIHIRENLCSISLDSSGASLHHRGYRELTNIAPMNEVLAAGILLHSGWAGKSDFLDPMCGSGTLLIEAAMIACNIPALINRKKFAFQSWPDYDEALFEKIREVSLARTRDFPYEIKGYDRAPSAIRKAQINIANAGLEEFIKIEQRDFFGSKKETKGPLHMVFNPPFGERLPVAVETFYSNIGDTLKQGYAGTNAWFITSNMEGLKHVGLRPSRKIMVFSGKLESRLVQYQMYEGSKKLKKQQN